MGNAGRKSTLWRSFLRTGDVMPNELLPVVRLERGDDACIRRLTCETQMQSYFKIPWCTLCIPLWSELAIRSGPLLLVRIIKSEHTEKRIFGSLIWFPVPERGFPDYRVQIALWNSVSDLFYLHGEVSGLSRHHCSREKIILWTKIVLRIVNVTFRCSLVRRVKKYWGQLHV